MTIACGGRRAGRGPRRLAVGRRHCFGFVVGPGALECQRRHHLRASAAKTRRPESQTGAGTDQRQCIWHVSETCWTGKLSRSPPCFVAHINVHTTRKNGSYALVMLVTVITGLFVSLHRQTDCDKKMVSGLRSARPLVYSKVNATRPSRSVPCNRSSYTPRLNSRE